jgi:hypothetical protein
MKMKLFIWKGVLFDYTDGVVFALAKNVEDARKAVWVCPLGRRLTKRRADVGYAPPPNGVTRHNPHAAHASRWADTPGKVIHER